MAKLDCGCPSGDRYYTCQRCRRTRCQTCRAIRHVCVRPTSGPRRAAATVAVPPPADLTLTAVAMLVTEAAGGNPFGAPVPSRCHRCNRPTAACRCLEDKLAARSGP